MKVSFVTSSSNNVTVIKVRINHRIVMTLKPNLGKEENLLYSFRNDNSLLCYFLSLTFSQGYTISYTKVHVHVHNTHTNASYFINW